MNAQQINRRVAAWLLSLPEPIEASDFDGALSEARQSFDVSVPIARFEQALRDCGYTFRSLNDRAFALTPIANDRVT